MRSPLTSLALAAAALALTGVGRREAAAAAPQPNIVLIIADDLGWADVGYHGGAVRTPNIDRLAAEGVQLEAHYAQPFCVPSRMALMTGRHPYRFHRTTHDERPPSSPEDWNFRLPLSETTLPAVLKEAGYRTSIIGKWHLGHTDPAYRPLRRGFERQYGGWGGDLKYFSHETKRDVPDWHRDDGPHLEEKGYATDLQGADAVRQIEAQPAGSPLFLYLSFNAPHDPLEVPDQWTAPYRGKLEGKRLKVAGMVACVDHWIGRIRAAIDKRSGTEETLVLFSSDNGGNLKQGGENLPLRGGKHDLYEGGLRVPMIAWNPTRLRPRVVSTPTHTVDWLPTLASLGGARNLPPSLDGNDISPLVWGSGRLKRSAILLNAGREGEALRAGRWKIARQPDSRAELFDLEADPREERDLAAERPDKMREMTELLDRTIGPKRYP